MNKMRPKCKRHKIFKKTKMYDNFKRKETPSFLFLGFVNMRSRVNISFRLSQERVLIFSYFSGTFLESSWILCSVLLVNVMSYVYILFVYTQYLRQQKNWLCSLNFPIVQTVNKSPDLLVGFDSF